MGLWIAGNYPWCLFHSCHIYETWTSKEVAGDCFKFIIWGGKPRRGIGSSFYGGFSHNIILLFQNFIANLTEYCESLYWISRFTILPYYYNTSNSTDVSCN